MAETTVAWQENKTQSERFHYMLENEIAWDVCFEICSPDGSTTLVRAHKVFLVAASPVFEAMFCGGMVEARSDSGNIRIPDIDAKTFKEMLRYIYCETANITADTAFPLMYAAKKYLLVALVRECATVLEHLNVDTVCTVLQQSMSLHENELKEKCLKFIGNNAHRVIGTEEFLRLSRDALDEVACLDILVHTSERQVYEYCVKWARHQLRESENESASDEKIREKLGSVLYKIRFPIMTAKDFAELTAHSTILTAEEQRDVYVYMTLGEKLDTLKFGVQRRQRVEEKVISRFPRIVGNDWISDGVTNAICFQTTVNMQLTGVGLYGGKEACSHDVTLSVLKGNETLVRKFTKMISDGRQAPIKIELETPVDIHANTRYCVTAFVKGPNTFCGEGGKTAYDLSESGRLVFYACKMPAVGDVCSGQIPQLFYCLG